MDDGALPRSEPPATDWSLLPLDTLASIFVRLGAVEVLMGAGLVCRSWLEAAKLPDVWRAVDMEKHEVVVRKSSVVLRAMAKAAVDRSGGQLRVFAGRFFVTDELLQYILERSPSLTTLRLLSCPRSKRLLNVIRESPLLELRSLVVEYSDLTVRELSDVLESCPVLEFVRVRCNRSKMYYGEDEEQALRAKFARIKTIKVEYDGPSLSFYSRMLNLPGSRP
ncbi:F-box protein SKIP19-like [Triticum aestivum]|uniref:F-box protein SKIP19-like n=1 Tax=Triticum aestivum TaxID=4565 RepID=UPI001D0198DC|nr:F-box protein SKIP19-like [Triticum aestivum]